MLKWLKEAAEAVRMGAPLMLLVFSLLPGGYSLKE